MGRTRPPTSTSNQPPVSVNVQPISLLPPCDRALSLYAKPNDYWRRAFKNTELIDRIYAYAGRNFLDGMRVQKFTFETLLNMVKQVHFSRPPDGRWSETDFVRCSGQDGDDYHTQMQLTEAAQKTSRHNDPNTDGADIVDLTEGQRNEQSITVVEISSNDHQPASVTIPTGASQTPLKSFPDGKASATGDIFAAPPDKRRTKVIPTKVPERGSDEDSPNGQSATAIHSTSPANLEIRDVLVTRLRHSEQLIDLFKRLASSSAGSRIEALRSHVREYLDADSCQRRCPVMKFPCSMKAIEVEFSLSNGKPTWDFPRPETRPEDIQRVDLRGAGPRWRDNSCSIDCCVVAGMFLHAGLTPADLSGQRYGIWERNLSPVSRAFRQLLMKDWEKMSKRENNALMAKFRNILNRDQLANHGGTEEVWKVGKMAPVVTVWNACTEGFGQFLYEERKVKSPCQTCGAQGQDGPYSLSSTIVLDTPRSGSPTGWTMEELLRCHFGGDTPARCVNNCHNGPTRRRRIQGEIPSRLAIIPPRQNSRITGNSRGHTANVNFEVMTDSGFPRKVSYRWIGGIYYSNHHFRTYWTDDLRTDSHEFGSRKSKICVYDGMLIGGRILGDCYGGRDVNFDERIHAPWGSRQVILFYERRLSMISELEEHFSKFVSVSPQPSGTPPRQITPEDPSSCPPGRKRRAAESLQGRPAKARPWPLPINRKVTHPPLTLRSRYLHAAQDYISHIATEYGKLAPASLASQDVLTARLVGLPSSQTLSNKVFSKGRKGSVEYHTILPSPNLAMGDDWRGKLSDGEESDDDTEPELGEDQMDEKGQVNSMDTDEPDSSEVENRWTPPPGTRQVIY